MRRLDRLDVLELHRRRMDLTPSFDRSPVQLGFHGEPWRTAVASILLNRTNHTAVRPVLRELLNTWPSPSDLAMADVRHVELVTESCGLWRRRSNTLVRFCAAWVEGLWLDLRDLPGVGPYVADAVGLFCFGDRSVESRDRILLRYALEFPG